MRGVKRGIIAAATLLLVGGCATAPKYHPAMVCQFVATGTLACVDAEELKARIEQGK